jgi:hypothetical protein
MQSLEESSYRSLLERRDIDAAARFLALFPDSDRCHELARIVPIWEESAAVHNALVAAEQGDIEGARRWSERIFDQARRSEVNNVIEMEDDHHDWGDAIGEGSAEAFAHYLTLHPQGRWAREAEAQIVEAERMRQQREPADWDRAWEAGTSAAWDLFLREHPDGQRLTESRLCREEAAEFETAVQLDTTSLWRAFLKSWPEGRHRLEAELRLARTGRPRQADARSH